MMKNLIVALTLMLAMVSVSVALPIGHTTGEGVNSVWPGAHYLIDEKAQYTPQQIINQPPFNLQSPDSPPNLGFITGQVWVWFSIEYVEPRQLQVSFAHLKEFNVYIYSKAGELLFSQLDIASKPYLDQFSSDYFPSVLLPKLEQAEVTVILQIKSDHALRLPINMASEKAFSLQKMARLSIVFLSLGMLLALCIYNSILFVSTSKLYYLFYSLNLALLQIFFLIDLGFGRYFLPVDHWINTPSIWAVSVCGAFIFAILFARSFLRLPKHYPKWNKWFLLLIFGVLIDIALVLFTQNELAIAFYLFISALYQISIIAVSIYVLKQGYQPARFFLLAWVFLAIGGFIYQLTIMGKVSVNVFTEHAFLIGTVVESLLLSLALAELINKLQTDQIASERHYQNILNKTGNRLAHALKIAEKHKKVRDVFLKNISHELKTPLHAIQHVLDLSVQGYQVNSELLHDANHSSRLISRHIDKLLMNTELGASEPDFQLEKVDIKPTLKVWYQDLIKECEARNTEFSLNSNLVDWDELTGPVRPVYLILTEIIYNAASLDIDSIILNFDYDQISGQLNIHLDMHHSANEEFLSATNLFNSPQDAAFVEQVIDLLSGQWSIELEHPDVVLDIHLPSFTVEKKHIENTLPERVLVVEDNEINQKVMVSMLRRMGIECDMAMNGEEALIKQAEQPASLILMDCQMPIMDGFDTTVAIRANAKLYQNPIVVAVSANSMELDKTHCLSVGMNDFIAKPVRMEELRSVLMRWGTLQ